MGVKFSDNSDKIKLILEQATAAGLEAAAAEVESQARRNSPVDTGQLKGAWGHFVNEERMEATIGNTTEHSIWNEFGTGEWALEGNGRKGGWFYKDAEGNSHFTHGIKPRRMLFNAFCAKKNAVIRIIEQALKDDLN